MLSSKDLAKIQELIELVLDVKLEKMSVDVDFLKSRVKYIPTKDEFFSESDKIYGELQKIRETIEIQSSY